MDVADLRLVKQRAQLRVRSYVVFHRIYESMGLGMHPTSLYPVEAVSPPKRRGRAGRKCSRVITTALYGAPNRRVKLL